MAEGVALLHLLHHPGTNAGTIRRYKKENRLTDDFISRVAVELFRTFVPICNYSRDVSHEDGILGGFYNGGESKPRLHSRLFTDQPLPLVLGVFPFRDECRQYHSRD